MDGLDFEVRLYRHLNEVAAYLEASKDAMGAIRYSLRAARDFFDAAEACLATLLPGNDRPELDFVLPPGSVWDLDLLKGFLRGERPVIPKDVLLAKVRRRDRAWGAIALRRRAAPFSKTDVRALSLIAAEISRAVQRIDRDRLLEVRARIDGKVVEQLPSKDLFYQVLDGLRSLTGYDHSSALLIYEPEPPSLRLAAEQIAWVKGKSRKIGLVLPLDDRALDLLRREEAVYGFDREGGRWTDWDDQGAASLAALLDYNSGDGAGPATGDSDDGARDRDVGGGANSGEGADRRERSMLCAPLTTREGPLGLLKVAGLHRGTFGSYEADLLRRFTSIASVAIQNSQKTETLQARMLDAVKKHAIVDLARGVSHDINNALGAVIPLVQQMQEETRAGRIDPAVQQRDLQQIEQSLQICRRIFGGMLSFARGSARTGGEGDIVRALDGTRDVLVDSLEKRGIRFALRAPSALPPVRGAQGDLEQLFLNLVTNARDAMPQGGLLTVTASRQGPTIEIVIEDTGTGIPPDRMAKIHEPFYTTKQHGAGLGLPTCRWIVWELRGEMRFDSEPGRGTRVTVHLPVHDPSATGSEPPPSPGAPS
jgi:two-component system NtrC family sensor kinase